MLSAAKRLRRKAFSRGHHVRTIQPLDLDTIVESVKRTSRLVIASDDVKSGGVGSEEFSSGSLEASFDYRRRTDNACWNAPKISRILFSPSLEQMYMPNADRKIVQAVDGIMGR